MIATGWVNATAVCGVAVNAPEPEGLGKNCATTPATWAQDSSHGETHGSNVVLVVVVDVVVVVDG